MREMLKTLCSLPGVSGREKPVRDYIISQISGFCEYSIDRLGNLIAFKKGRKPAKNKILLDAHMDEVGLIATSVCDNGLIKFDIVGGIEPSILPAKRIRFENTPGVVGAVPVHLLDKDKTDYYNSVRDMYIDIGAVSIDEAARIVAPGDVAWFDVAPRFDGNILTARAVDDRAGCAQLVSLIREESAYDFYALFSVQEEIGMRGAKAAAYAVEPDFAIVLEATTAADIPGVPREKCICKLGEGVAVSFMDRATMYDPALYGSALALAAKNGIKAQPKAGTSGGNNAGAIHLTRNGIKTVTLSTPCRYLHSPSCTADLRDIEASKQLAKALIAKYASD